MDKIVYLHESELTKLKGLIANGEKKIVFNTRGEEPLTVNINVDAGNFKFDLADVVMYALDNGKHNVDISLYDQSAYIYIGPIKKKEEAVPVEEPEDIRNCNNCKHRGSIDAWKPIDSTTDFSPCYSCVTRHGGRDIPSHWEPKGE